ncbi:LacI family DNA-binding transcriptional regulator [Leekyejoonella antrihumi]|uniref:LacI family transcriptional regulator n=1 Tax=Leekyejoonella antrihumi TaxID=1660198 RepID=A0A563DVH4_9MICO|nr:LacI family DNA-binding transcriptional regulator [Leekyejoonella antrihumi]TWP33942.1 LacI family transcriptional regulator [Leekyejoonella antrihumi]
MVQSGGSVTLSDVAREAGVSVATASRALNGSSRTVRPDLSARVAAAARRLDYAPNAQAQAMARGATTMVGLIVHDIADPYFSAIAAGVSRAADDAGLLVMLSNTLGRPEQELRYLKALRAQRGRAAILVGSQRTDRDHSAAVSSEVAAFEHAGGRVVAISQARLPVDTIVIENAAGAGALARKLAEMGHSRFGVLAGPSDLLTARDRHRGFQRGAVDAGCAPPIAVHGAFTRDGGHSAMAQLLDSGCQIDCVFAVNDVMAVGAIAACRDRGLQLPKDLAIAGFDDIATLRDITPSLTTVRLPLTELGKQAMELVTAPPGTAPKRSRVKGTVVIRDSTPAHR